MSVFENLRTAIGGLTTNKMRASLTMLGMIIGVAAVVTLLSVGQGVQTEVTNQIESIGSNLLTIIAYQPTGSTAPAQLTNADATALANPYNAPALAAVREGAAEHCRSRPCAVATRSVALRAAIRPLLLLLIRTTWQWSAIIFESRGTQ